MPSKKNQSALESSAAFLVKVEDLVRETIVQNDVLFCRIESQMEERTQMDGTNLYIPVIRISTYFEDTITQLCDLVRSKFDVAAERSADNTKTKFDSFSNKEVQFIVGLTSNRLELTEYKRLGDRKFEIHLCSILQEALGCIAKELGYYSNSFPDDAKRDFYRAGTLLEMAEMEFLKIRNQLLMQKPDSIKSTLNQQPDTVIINIGEEILTQISTNQLDGHLVTVTKEVPSDDVNQPQVVVNAFPAQPQAIFQPAVGQPHIVAQPQVVVSAAPPVQQQPQVTVQQAQPYIYANAVPAQPQPKEAAVKPEHLSALQSVVPKRAVPPTPKGLAPHRVKAPTIKEIEAMEMDVDRAKSVALNISQIENKNGISETQLSALMNNNGKLVENTQGQDDKLTNDAIEQIVNQELGHHHHKEEVELNIESVHNFNMNVNNSIVEKTIEIVKEPEKITPFFEDVPLMPKKQEPLDENAPMTEASLKEYVSNSKLVHEIDAKIAERAGAKINSDIDIEGDVERLRFLKVFTLKQLHDRITDNKDDIVAFAEKWIGKDNGGSFDSGICLFYLEYLLVGKKNDPAFSIEYVVKFISDNDYSARYIIPTYNSIRNTETSNFSHLTLKA